MVKLHCNRVNQIVPIKSSLGVLDILRPTAKTSCPLWVYPDRVCYIGNIMRTESLLISYIMVGRLIIVLMFRLHQPVVIIPLQCQTLYVLLCIYLKSLPIGRFFDLLIVTLLVRILLFCRLCACPGVTPMNCGTSMT